MTLPIDISPGDRFGRLVAIERAEKQGEHQYSFWLCQCDCGTQKIVRAYNLAKGNTRSCGCSKGTHGFTNTPEYMAYTGAKRRCNNPNAPEYRSYGGRGIEFRFKSFDEFLAEVGRRPSAAYSLDRINVNDHYRPGNIRWATREEQAANKRRCVCEFCPVHPKLADSA